MAHSIYPRDFFEGSADVIDHSLCFVLMPFDPAFQSTFEDAIRPAVEQAGLRCLRADSIFSPEPILVTVMDHINRANLLVADLSGKNANVFYELGMAHVVKQNQRVILLARSMDDVPFDLRHLRLILYNDDYRGFERLKSDLGKAIESIQGMAVQSDHSVTSTTTPAEDHPSGEAADDSQESHLERSSGQIPSGSESPGMTIGAPDLTPLHTKSSAEERFPQSWTKAQVVFLAGNDTELSGRFGAKLLQWFSYNDLSISPRKVDFPFGSLTLSVSASLDLGPMSDRDVSLYSDAVGKEILRINYWTDHPYDVAKFADAFRSLHLPITLVTETRIVLTPSKEYGSVELLRTDRGGTVLACTAGESGPYKSGFTIPFAEATAFLEGRLSVEDFGELQRGSYLGMLV